MHRMAFCAAVVTVMATHHSAVAHQTTASPPRFEVASIKPSPPQPPGRNNSSIRRSTGGRFTTVNAAIKPLMQIAFRVRDFQIVGGPAWIEDARFDIVAVPDREIVFDNRDTDPMPRMLQMFLEERFQLKVHRETKEMPVYALLIARNGMKLQTAKEADGKNWGFNNGPNGLTATNAPMSIFADVLSDQVGRTVINRTGLNEYFNFTLKWVPTPPAAAAQDPNLPSRPTGPDGPSIFTALQEQLGLRLESERGPVEVIVIDSVERPTEN